MAWGVAGGLFLFFMLILVNAGRFVRVVVFDPDEIQYLAMMVIGFVLMAVLLYLLLTYVGCHGRDPGFAARFSGFPAHHHLGHGLVAGPSGGQ
jgi:hypothetical protein